MSQRKGALLLVGQVSTGGLVGLTAKCQWLEMTAHGLTKAFRYFSGRVTVEGRAAQARV